MKRNVVNNWRKLHPDLKDALIHAHSVLDQDTFTNPKPFGMNSDMCHELANRGLLEPELRRLETSIIVWKQIDGKAIREERHYENTGRYRLTNRGSDTLRKGQRSENWSVRKAEIRMDLAA